MKISEDIKLDFDDILIRPQRSTLVSRKDVSLMRSFLFYNAERAWMGVPLIVSNMATTGTIAMAKVLPNYMISTALHKFTKYDDLENIVDESSISTWVTIGQNESKFDELEKLSQVACTSLNIVIDVANGHRQCFVDFCAKVRKRFPKSIIMAGNVCTPEMVQELILHGSVDVVKIQIGPGKQCKTRMITGVGYPTASCIMECADAAHGLNNGTGRNGLICSDGGCKYPGDICKAICLGADFVMAGSIFAGHEECDGEWVEIDGERYLKHYGMSSHLAQEKHGDGRQDHRASEGSVSLIKSKGPVSQTVQEILGGIRSCCTYIGAKSVKDMSKCASFIKTNKIHDNFHQTEIG